MPDPPYVAVIFTSLLTPGDDGYGAATSRIEELAAQQPGYRIAQVNRDYRFERP